MEKLVDEKKPNWILDLAGELSAPPQIEPPEWTREERLACRALALAALRQRDLPALNAAATAFGGLPMGCQDGDSGDLLWVAAGDPEAFGFGEMIGWMLPRAALAWEKRCERDRKEGRDPWGDESWGLGAWLRTGMIFPALSHAELDERYPRQAGHELTSAAQMRSAPVAAALARDCPMALAKILNEPGLRQALASLEPSGSMEGAFLPTREAREMAGLRGAQMEATLLWQALASGAGKCAMLLSRVPEFAKALEPGRLGWSMRGNFALSRGVEESSHASARADLETQPWASLPHWVAGELLTSQAHGSLSEAGRSIARWLNEAANHAPESAKAQGWAQARLRWALGARDYSNRKSASERAIDALASCEAQGLAIDALACAAMCEKQAPEAARWIEAREISNAAGSAAKRGARPL